MTAVALEELGNGIIQDTTGKALSGHSIFVYQRGTTTQVQVYSDAAGTVPLAQPLVTTSTGAIPGYVIADQPLDLYDQTANRTVPTEAVSAADVAANMVAAAGALLKASNLADVVDADSSRANLKVPTLRHAQCVATTNQATSGALPTIDGYAVQDGDRVLLTGQTFTSQNGPWIAHTAGWVRPNDYPAAGVVTSRSLKVSGGTVYAGTDWVLVSTASITIDTTAAPWKIMPVTAGQLPASVATGSQLELGSLGASHTIDFGSKPNQIVMVVGTLTANHVMTFANRAAGCRAILLLTQDGTGSRTFSVSDGSTTTAVPVAGGSGSFSAVEVDCPDATNLFVSMFGASLGSTARTTLSAAQSIPNSAWTAVIWTGVAYDTGGAWAAGSPTRLTVPATGRYRLTANGEFTYAGGAGAYRAMRIKKNGTVFLAADTGPLGVTAMLSCGTEAALTAADYIELEALQDSGGALNFGAGAAVLASLTLTAL